MPKRSKPEYILASESPSGPSWGEGSYLTGYFNSRKEAQAYLDAHPSEGDFVTTARMFRTEIKHGQPVNDPEDQDWLYAYQDAEDERKEKRKAHKRRPRKGYMGMPQIGNPAGRVSVSVQDLKRVYNAGRKGARLEIRL